MSGVTFTVVIPTRNRADVLRSTIATAMAQDDPDVKILVSDNASSDGTRAMVESLADPRIQYINPGAHLGMTEHWEFALSKAPNGYLTVLGDDDGLLPDAVSRARRLITEHGVKALAWRKAEYHWPDHIVPSYRNWLQVPFGDVVELNAASTLREVLAFRRTYTDLACIYNSFVATDVLAEIRGRSGGRLLHSVTPDIYSGIAVACVLERHLFSGIPLSINAASRHSNGTMTSFRGVNTPRTAEHFQTTGERMHPRLVRSSSVPILIADAALIAREHLIPPGGWPELDWPAMFELALRYAERRPTPVLDETLRALDEIAHRNGMQNFWMALRKTADQKPLPDLQPPGWDDSRSHLAIDGAKVQLFNVADAAALTLGVLQALAARDSNMGSGVVSEVARLQLQHSKQALWDGFLSQLERPAPIAPPTGVRRYWRSIRFRVARLLNSLEGRHTA